MTAGSSFKQLPSPLAFTLQLAPVRARLLVLAAAAALTLFLFAAFGGMLENVEERVGAQGWKIGPTSVATTGTWPRFAVAYQ